MGSFRNTLENLKLKGTKRGDTFGTPYSKYEKSMILGAKNHYFGKGI